MSDKTHAAPQRHGMYRLAGASSYLLALTLVAIGITYLFIPEGMKVVGTGDPAAYYQAMIDHPGPIFTLEWETVPLGLLGVAVVLGLTRWARVDPTEGWLTYTGLLACFGFLLKALDSLRGTALHQLRADMWLAGDTSTREAIGATRLTLDYLGWFAFGAVGLWAISISVAVWRQGRVPWWFSVAGCAFGGGFILLMVGEILVVHWLLDASVAIAAPAALVWFTSVGRLLLGEARHPEPADASAAADQLAAPLGSGTVASA